MNVEYNVGLSSDEPKHYNQDREEREWKNIPIASVTPYSTFQSIYPFPYATSRNPSPKSNKISKERAGPYMRFVEDKLETK